MKRIFVLMMAIGGWAMYSPVFSQSSRVYTLEECISEVVDNNLTLRNADNQIAMSEQQSKEAYTKYFPTVSATGGGFVANKGLIEMSMAGMEMSMAKDGLVAGVTAMQPLFAGGQIVNGNKLAKVGVDVAKLQRKLSQNEIVLRTEQYYWQMVSLKEKLHTLDQLEQQLDRMQQDAQNAVEAGVRNRNDLLQVQLRRNEVSTSKIQVANALSVTGDLLAQMMGLPPGTVDVASRFPMGSDVGRQIEEYSMPESPQQYYQSEETCLALTSEYQLLNRQIDAERLQYRMAVGKNLPSVAVGGGYMYNNVMDKSQNRFVGMLTVSVPVSSWWGGSHNMKRQKIQVINAENDKRNQSEMLVIRMRKAWNDMNDAYRQILIAQESIVQSEENLRLNTDYYEAGTASISDLLDAQTLFQQSRDKYVESLADYEVKKREYLQATGR